MGLDSTIVLHTQSAVDSNELPDWVWLEKRDDSTNDYVLVYFRKSYGFRHMMNRILEKYKIQVDPMGGKYDLPNKINFIDDLQNGLYNFLLNPDDWDDESQIFYMDTCYKTIAQAILNLTWMKQYMEKHPTVYLEYIDSF